MKAKIMLGMILGALGLSGCAEQPEAKLAVVRGQTYLIPWNNRVKIDVENPIPVYVNIYPVYKKFPFKIRVWYQSNNYELFSAKGIPDIFGITGNTEKDVLDQLKVVKVNQENVFCKKNFYDNNNHLNCGFRVQDGDVSWSVNFDEDFVDAASSIKTETLRILKSYREAANAKQR